MPDLKISEFADGGAVQNTDEIAAVREGINTKVTVGSAAAADTGTGPDDIPLNSDLGEGAFNSVGKDIGDLVQLEDVGGSPGLPDVDGSQLTGVIPGTINGLVTAGGNVTITGAGTALDPYEINSTSSVATSAEDVTYDNSVTGITATNAQDAIDQTYALADTALQPNDVPLKQSFTSGQQTITSGGTLSLSHGLGGIPFLVFAELVCLSADIGYAVGDVVPVNISSSGASSGSGISVVSKASSVDVKYGSDTGVFRILRKDTGAVAGATNANWRLVIRAWR